MRREHKEQGFGHVAMRITFPTPCDLSPTGTHEAEISLAKDWRLVGAGCPCTRQREALDVARSLHDEHRVLCCLDVVDAAHAEANGVFASQDMRRRAPVFDKIMIGKRRRKIAEPSTRDGEPTPLPAHLAAFAGKIGVICKNYRTHVRARIRLDEKPVVRLASGNYEHAIYHGAGRWQIRDEPKRWWFSSYDDCPICPGSSRHTDQHQRTAKHERNAAAKLAALLNEINELFVHDWRNPK